MNNIGKKHKNFYATAYMKGKTFGKLLKYSNFNIYLKKIDEKINDYDYIIVGGGSAGCVLLNRLSENPNTKVLLIEAGKWDKGNWDSWKIQMPSALTYNIGDSKYDWNYLTSEQKHLNNRRLALPRGKVLGGSSSLNAMCYIRGNPLDYEKWAETVPGWEFKNCLPYFKKAQTHQLGENEFRGGKGPLYVSRLFDGNKLIDDYINAGLDCGYSYTDDFNGFRQEGFGPMDATIKNGIRCSASFAYIHDILPVRKNIEIKCEHFVNKLIFAGKKAVGLEVFDQKKKETKKIFSNKEIILCGGAINSPQILLLSGVGDNEELEKIGIEPVHNLPDVGKNLQDHLEVYLQYKCKTPLTINKYANWLPNPMPKSLAGLQWLYNKTGICAKNHFEAGCFMRSQKGIEFPDIQHHFFPGAVEQQKDVVSYNAYQVHVGTMRPKSRGKIKLKSKNPGDLILDPNLFDENEDLEDLCEAVKLAVEVMNAKSLQKHNGGPINIKEEIIFHKTDLQEWVKKHVESAYHISCTCAMGKVTDSKGRVFGIENLRVCDASIMPNVVSGNTNAPTIMIAEKIADCIKGEKLKELDIKYYIEENWETKQR